MLEAAHGAYIFIVCRCFVFLVGCFVCCVVSVVLCCFSAGSNNSVHPWQKPGRRDLAISFTQLLRCQL